MVQIHSGVLHWIIGSAYNGVTRMPVMSKRTIKVTETQLGSV